MGDEQTRLRAEAYSAVQVAARPPRQARERGAPATARPPSCARRAGRAAAAQLPALARTTTVKCLVT
jgi:hypothetical protein